MDWVPKDWDTRDYGLVIGIEADAADRPDWHDWYSRALQFCQWTIQSKPGHPALQDVVANITQEVLAMKERHMDTLETDEETGVERLRVKDLDKSVVELTGPAVWTDSVFRYLNSEDIYILDKGKRLRVTPDIFHGLKAQKLVGDVVVLPITSFSPGVGQMGAENDDSDMAFVKHEFDVIDHIGTWKPHEDEDSENEDDEKASAETSSSPAS
ncbi:membrane-bound alpha-1,6- mannosyltransferase Initiation-specific [Ascosphaera atra]|nr:membrane-bound alpha-1,6- mannosyltransferase Initiation-specific [Ascosphaera atra]